MKTFTTWLESKSDFFRTETQPASPAAALNQLAGKMAGNVISGNTTYDKAAAYIKKKTTNSQDFDYVMEMLRKHLEDEYPFQ